MAFLRPTRGGGFEFVEYDDNAFRYPQEIGKTADSISGLGPADETMLKTIFIMPNKSTNPDATLMIVVDEKEPNTDPKTYQYVYVGNINDLPSDVLTESSIVNDLSTGGTDKPLSAEQGRTLNSHVNYVTCGSNAEDQVKLISNDGFELSTHLRLLVMMNNTNTHATPKFNINNTGIKDVWYNESVASDTNTWAAGEVLDIYYDGTKYIATTYGGAQFSTGEKVSDVGIDEDPTAESENLVKSGGIYPLKQELNDFLDNQTIEFGFDEKTGNNSASQYIGMPIIKDGILESIYLNCSASGTISIQIYTNFTTGPHLRKTISKDVEVGTNTISLSEFVYKNEGVVVSGATVYWVNDLSFEQIFYMYGSGAWVLRSDNVKWSAGYVLNYTAIFEKFKDNILGQLRQSSQESMICTIRSGGGRAVQHITGYSTQSDIELVFANDTVFYGNLADNANAYVVAPTNGVVYTFTNNFAGLFLNFDTNTLSIENCNSVLGLKSALNSPGKVLVAIRIYGYLISPIPSLQVEFDQIQFGGEIAITENTPNNYTTKITKGGVDYYVANKNVSDYFKQGSVNFGLFEKTGNTSSSQVIGMPISNSGKMASIYLNNAESATISIKIYNSGFSEVRKTFSKNVVSGENTITLNEDVTAGENIVLENIKVYYREDSSFEQIFWYNYPTGWALRSDHIKWSAGYTIVSESAFDALSDKVDNLDDKVNALEYIEYVKVTVERNPADYNSVRETIEAITDASYYKRYTVIVPIGRWFECDIKGKKYVTILGEDEIRTVLYCDGTSSNLTPADYSFPTYAGQALSSINQAYKHCINLRDDIDIQGLTIEVNDCKYCAHIDNSGFKMASFKNITFKEVNANVTFTIGIGSRGGQEITFDKCDFKAYDTHTICAYVHNWNNQIDVHTITFKNCRFNKNFFRYDELGSDYSTFLNLLNCYSKTSTPQLVFQTVTTGTPPHSHWINPETGQPITDMTQLPYCTHIDVCGSNVASIYQDGTRPDIANYIIGKIGI